MDEKTKFELNWRKFEYELINGKLNLNIARLDKLWIALVGSILLAVSSALKTQELRLLYVFLPIISSVWLALFLYVLGQIERQKIVAVLHSKEINRLLGKDILVYELKVMNKLWRYDKKKPSIYVLILNIVLLAPVLLVWSFTVYKGYGLVAGKAGYIGAYLYAGISSFILLAGVLSFIWARKKREDNSPLKDVIEGKSIIEIQQ